MSDLSSLHRMLLCAISQVRARQFSKDEVIAAAHYLLQIPNVIEVWSSGDLKDERHLPILLEVPNKVFKKYADFLGRAPDLYEQGIDVLSILLVLHRIAMAETLNSNAFWAAIAKTETTIEVPNLGDSLFIMLVPQHWKKRQQLRTELALPPNSEFLQKMVDIAEPVEKRSLRDWQKNIEIIGSFS